MDLALPQFVSYLLEQFSAKDFEAYVVGGCVRDSLMGKKPYDWDITTSASPNQVLALFQNTKATVIPTGIKHGTVTVIVEGNSIEVTTFRTEQNYSDHRHPDAVSFTSSLQEDLKRRDFTINAIAYSPTKGMIDLFGGQQDIRSCLLRCVGKPEQRFDEDALRIMRALRFSSTLGFDIETNTASSLRKKASLLQYIAVERIAAELNKMICGNSILPVLINYPSVIGQWLPEILPCIGFCQHNDRHQFDIWEHTARAVSSSVPLLPVRLSLLLHDLAKPACFFLDENGIGHYPDHSQKGAYQARKILTRLHYDSHTIDMVTTLIRNHSDTILPTRSDLCHWLNRIGEKELRYLLMVKEADIRAKSSKVAFELKNLAKIDQQLTDILSSKDCYSLKQLAVNGHDLINAGFSSGPQIGAILNFLLNEVIDHRCNNQKEVLLFYAKKHFRSMGMTD